MTQSQVKATIKAIGMHASIRDGEWRVTYPYGEGPDAWREDCAYYTTDAQDAIDTARTMRAHRDGTSNHGGLQSYDR